MENLKIHRRPLINPGVNTLEEVEVMFINEQKARQNSQYTIEHYERSFKRMCGFLAYQIRGYQIEQITKDITNQLFIEGRSFPLAVLEMDDIQRLYTLFLLDVVKVKPQTVESYMRDFKAFYFYCSETNEWIKPLKITIRKAPVPIKNTYTDAEIDKLLIKPNVANFVEYRDWVIINYLLSTGNRVQTIINLQVGDVDTKIGYVNIRVQKNGTITRIPLVKKMCKILDEYIALYRDEPDDYLFCNRYGEQLSPEGLKKAIASYNRRRGVNKTSIHLFRHSFSKAWITTGGSTVSLQKMLGHTTTTAVQHYLNIYGTELAPLAEQNAMLNKHKTNSGRTLQPNFEKYR